MATFSVLVKINLVVVKFIFSEIFQLYYSYYHES